MTCTSCVQVMEKGYKRLTPDQPVGLRHAGYVITVQKVIKVSLLVSLYCNCNLNGLHMPTFDHHPTVKQKAGTKERKTFKGWFGGVDQGNTNYNEAKQQTKIYLTINKKNG